MRPGCHRACMMFWYAGIANMVCESSEILRDPVRVAPQPLRARRRRRILAAGLEGSASRCPSGGKVPQSGLIMLALPMRIAAAATTRELRRGRPYSHCEARVVGGFSQLAGREHRRGAPETWSRGPSPRRPQRCHALGRPLGGSPV